MMVMRMAVRTEIHDVENSSRVRRKGQDDYAGGGAQSHFYLAVSVSRTVRASVTRVNGFVRRTSFSRMVPWRLDVYSV